MLDSLWKTVWRSLRKLKLEPPSGPVIPLWGTSSLTYLMLALWKQHVHVPWIWNVLWQSWQVHLQGVRKFHGSDYKQSNTFKIILWGISLNGKGKHCFIKKMLKLQIREYGMKEQWSWHGSSCRRNESDIKRSDFMFSVPFRDDLSWPSVGL